MKMYIILLLVLMCACDSKYKYIEVGYKTTLGNTEQYTEAKEFTAAHDTVAYEKAYSMYHQNILVYMEASQRMDGSVKTTPTSFTVIDEKGNDISNIFFVSKDSKEKAILSELDAIKNKIVSNKNESSSSQTTTINKPSLIDQAKAKSLSVFFNKEKDEYSNDNEYWYKPKSAPKHINKNAVYCYFKTKNESAGNFRFVIQYASEDWIFYEKALFSIDGVAYSYIPSKTERDSGNGGVWEWSDESVDISDMTLIEALASAKKAKMKLLGSQYHKEYTLTQQQLLSIKQSLELYKSLGGI